MNSRLRPPGAGTRRIERFDPDFLRIEGRIEGRLVPGPRDALIKSDGGTKRHCGVPAPARMRPPARVRTREAGSKRAPRRRPLNRVRLGFWRQDAIPCPTP